MDVAMAQKEKRLFVTQMLCLPLQVATSLELNSTVEQLSQSTLEVETGWHQAVESAGSFHMEERQSFSRVQTSALMEMHPAQRDHTLILMHLDSTLLELHSLTHVIRLNLVKGVYNTHRYAVDGLEKVATAEYSKALH